MVLDEIKSDLSDAASRAWDFSDEDIAKFGRNLEETAQDNDLSDGFTDCVEDTDVFTGDAIETCMENHLTEQDAEHIYRENWESDEAQAIVDNLRTIRTQWGSAERSQSRTIAAENDLDTLHKHCARGNKDALEDALGEEAIEQAVEQAAFDTMTSYAECVEVVAAVQDVSGDLKDEWETAE